jgi:hypothetical protein
LQDINLVAGHDIRFMKHTGRPYSSKAAYTALDCAGEEEDPHGKLVWETRVPNKVKIFAWLYLKNRLSTRCALFAKHIVNSCTCERCDAANEDRHHVFFACPESKRVWVALGMESICYNHNQDIWAPVLPANLDAVLWPFVLLMLLWRIWDARNGHIFRAEGFSGRVVLSRARDDLVIWKKCLPDHLVNSFSSWLSHICAGISDDALRSV